MMNRAVVQPDPAIFTGMVADTMHAAEQASSLDDLFLRLEDAGIMLRIDRTVTPTMAKAPTLATWELDQLRTLENVVRRGHLEAVGRGRLVFGDGAVTVASDAVVVHCAADGLKYPPLVPVWRPDAITLQPIRSGFPCFGAALVGYVEATRDDDAEKNRLCPPTPYGNSMAEWARMNVLGARATKSFSSEPDIADWSSRVALNPARIPPGHPGSDALDHARERLAAHAPSGLARLAELVDRPQTGVMGNEVRDSNAKSVAGAELGDGDLLAPPGRARRGGRRSAARRRRRRVRPRRRGAGRAPGRSRRARRSTPGRRARSRRRPRGRARTTTARLASTYAAGLSSGWIASSRRAPVLVAADAERAGDPHRPDAGDAGELLAADPGQLLLALAALLQREGERPVEQVHLQADLVGDPHQRRVREGGEVEVADQRAGVVGGAVVGRGRSAPARASRPGTAR